MIVPIVLACIVLFCLGMAVLSAWYRTTPAGKKMVADNKARRAAAPQYCTKHQVVQQGPGGPDKLVWVYGTHRTPGNACDGTEHQRGVWWW
jgi:hypothetical protein